MSIAVYPRLDELLESRHMTIAEVESQLQDRFGLTVDGAMLHKTLLGDEPVRRVDLDVVAAVAAILGVPIDALFVVETSPDGAAPAFEEEEPVLGPEDSRRMGELFDRATLSKAEAAELQGLVDKYGRLLHQRRVREIARKRGVPEEQVQRESEVAVAEALDWLRAFNADPQGREELARLVAQRRARQGE